MSERFEAKIEALAYGGDGIGHAADGLTLFVPFAAPGDFLRIEIRERHQRYARAKLLEILEPGPERVSPPCSAAGRCGGCQWQHLNYAAQLAAKENFLRESLRRIAGLSEIPLKPILPAASPFAYRNKAIVALNSGQLGFYREGSHEIVDLPSQGCAIQSEASSRALLFLRDRLHKNSDIQHALVRSNGAGESMIALVSAKALEGDYGSWLKELPGLKGVLNNLQPKISNTILGSETRLLVGEDHLIETIEGLHFRLSATSFFQVNSLQVPRLWKLIESLRSWRPGEKLLELYCGIGTLSLALGRLGVQVLGVESWKEAVEDAKANANLNSMTNLRFECGDALYAPELGAEATLALLDPPRKGLPAALLPKLSLGKIRELIYVSCDPSSLARDLKGLISLGWKLESIQALDMFPQTYHVESVNYLKR